MASLAPGVYKVTLSKAGYATETRNVEVVSGNSASLDVKLTPAKGYLSIAGTPAGARIVIDGKETGKATPAEFTLDPAVHSVTLRKEGYLDSTSDIKLAAGQSVSYAPSLKLAGRTDNIQVMGGFKKLFGGGHAFMKLTDEENSIESGIDIVASPPGKKLQNVLLLSGGEKALTALSLLVGIFQYQPSPFCILDEVDAPLDEANVGRFTKKVVDMSANTQFIVITHNKRTMETARALYGVTMEEVGVSKLVSVRFE